MHLARRTVLLLGLPGLAHMATGAAAAIKLYGDDKFPPYTQLLDGRPQGRLLDRLKQIETALALPFEIELTGWRRAVQQAEQGRGGLVGVSHTLARAQWLDYSRPLAVDEVHLISLRRRGLAASSLRDLQGLRIGVGNGISFGQAFEEALAAGLFHVERDWGPMQRLRMVLAGRLDGALLSGGLSGFEALLAQDPALAEQRGLLTVSPRPLLFDPLHIGLPKRWQRGELLERVNAALAALDAQPR